MEVLTSFADIEPTSLPLIKAYDHQIPLKERSNPVNIRPYKYDSLQKDIIEQMTNELLDAGEIQHISSPFASPVILVKKKDNSLRTCVDYGAFNNMTIKDRFPMPVIEKLLDELEGAVVFSKLDLQSGYHQICMHPLKVSKTAFRTHVGHFECLVMPFGLTNAPSTF